MSITLILILLTGLISYQAFQNPAMRQQLIFHPATIKSSGEFYRFVTHGFIHADWSHLLINMYVLYLFGEYAENQIFYAVFGGIWGKLVYILFYLSAIVISSVPSFFRHQDNYGYAALGASGATSALVFAFVLFNPWQWFIFPPLPAIIFGVAYLWYSSYMDKRGMDNIGHNAHFWGAVYGLAFIILSVVTLKPQYLDLIIGRIMAGPGPLPF